MMDSRGQHEILTYDYDKRLETLLLREISAGRYVMEKDGKKIGTTHINGELRSMMKELGYAFTKEDAKYYTSIKQLYGCRVDVVWEVENRQIMTFKIHVRGMNVPDARKNAKKIVQSIYEDYGIKPIHVDLLTRVEC